MLFSGTGLDAEAQLIRNIRILSTRSPSSSADKYKDNLLGSFVRDLCFWDAPQVQTKKKQHALLTTRDNSFCYSVSTAGSSRASNKSKGMKQGDNRRCRSSLDSSEAPASKPIWKTTKDPVTGRTYYYDAITRKTQWNKPAEIEAMEKRKRAEKRKKDLAFFKIMEHTLLASLERGELIPDIPLTETKKEGAPIEPVPLAAQRVRTISSMDQVLLADLRDDGDVVKQQQQSRAVQYYSQNSQTSSSSSPDKYGRPPLPNAPKSRSSLYNELDALDASMVPDETGACSNNENTDASFQQEYTDSDLAGIHLLDAPIQTECDLSEIDNIGQPLGHTRRNTGGTIYLENTMEKPDIKATIKCVCSVFRAHILQAAENRTRRSPISVVISPLDREVFRDDYDQPRKRKDPKVPSFNEVLAFYDEFYRRSQMESDTIIMSLIYVERLIKASNGALTPMPENWRSILLSCMVLASKVWDDLSMWNIDFSNVSANTAGLTHFTLHRINDLEIALLKSLNFDVKVPASEYAKYYFLIRTMLLRSGLMKEVEQPLGKEDAYFRTLEARTDDFQDEKLVQVGRDRRTKSMDFLTRTGETPKADPICLEQLVG